MFRKIFQQISSPESLESVPAPVQKALITICEKCGRKLGSDKDGKDTPSQELRKILKEKCAEVFGKGYVRAVTSSCLDICPKERIAVGILPLVATGGTARFVTVDPKNLDAAATDLVMQVEEHS